MGDQEPKGFKVVDKRGQPDEERTTAPPPLVTPPGADAAQRKPGPEPPPPADDGASHATRRPGEGPSFLDLVGTLQFGALADLGMIQAPDGTRSPVRLEAAKESIDLLSILQEKTKGNLTPEEADALNQGLYHIRMAYVTIVNAVAGGPAGGKKT